MNFPTARLSNNNYSGNKDDRIQIIRRSLRCFTMGLIGMIPLVGMGLALIAFQIFIQVCCQTGELLPRRWSLIYKCLFIFTVLIACMNFWLGFCCLIFSIITWLFLLLQTWQILPNVWNPARKYLFLGFGFSSVSLLVHGVVVIYPIIQKISDRFF